MIVDERSERVSEDEDREARAFREAMRDVRRLPRARQGGTRGAEAAGEGALHARRQVEVLRESLLPPQDEAALAHRR